MPGILPNHRGYIAFTGEPMSEKHGQHKRSVISSRVDPMSDGEMQEYQAISDSVIKTVLTEGMRAKAAAQASQRSCVPRSKVRYRE
jgi:hypothetical protein